MLSGLKLIYSEINTKFCEISTADLFYVVPVRYTMEISQNFVASEYRNFTRPKVSKILQNRGKIKPITSGANSF